MKKYDELTRLLDFMEENIDLEHIRTVEQLQYDTINYNKVNRLPLTVCTDISEYKQLPLKMAYNNPEMMLYNEILSSSGHSSFNSVHMKDDSPLMIRSNHGMGIISTMFGCKTVFSNNQVPCVDPISLVDAKKIFAKGLPDVRSGLGKNVIETYQYYHDRLKSYPNCYRALRITQPEMMGPFDILYLILGSDMKLMLNNNTQLVKYMLDVVAHTYVNFRKEIDLLLTDKINDAIFVKGLCCGGRVLVNMDTVISDLSLDKSNICESDALSYILGSFSRQGGGSLHYSGNSKPWYEEVGLDKNLRCINYHNSTLHNLKEAYAYCKEHKIGVVGWGLDQDYKDLIQEISTADEGGSIKTGVTLKCKAADIRHGIEIVKKHKNNIYLQY